MNNNNNNNEILFWKVFRNKFLFQKIFSNFIFKDLFNYDRLNNITSFCDIDKSIEIIKDKIKCGSYFSLMPYGLNDLVIGKFNKLTDENIRLYQQLFKTYENYFKYPEAILPDLIAKSNKSLLMLEQYIKYYNLSKERIVEIYIDRIKNKLIFIFENYQSFKVYNYLKINYSIPCSHCLIKMYSSEFIFSNDFKFKQLIKICKILLNYKLCEGKVQISFNDIESIKRKFTKDQLNLNILQLLKSLNKEYNGFGHYIDFDFKDQNIIQKEKHLIYQLLELFYKFPQDNKPMQYYYIFSNSEEIEKNLIVEQKNLYSLFQNKYYHIDLLLSRCNSRKEQFQFISNQINNIIMGYNKDEYLLENILITIIQRDDIELLKYYIDNNHGNFLNQIVLNNIDEIIKSIQSIKILEFFFNQQIFKDQIFKDNNTHWNCFSRIELIEFYESKMNACKRSLLIDKYQKEVFFIKWWGDCINPITLDLLLRAINIYYNQNQETSKLYKLSDGFDINRYFVVFKDFTKDGSFLKNKEQSNFISIIKSIRNLETLYFYKIFNKVVGFHIIATWIFSNNIEDLPNNLKGKTDKIIIKIKNNENIISIILYSFQYIQLLFSVGRYSEIFSINGISTVVKFHIINNDMVDTDKVEFVDELVNNLLNEKEYIILYNFINEKAYIGQITTFKLISSKYQKILKIKSNSDNNEGIFNLLEIKEILKQAISSGNIEIIEIIFNLSKIEFTNYDIRNIKSGKKEIILNYFNLNNIK